MALRLPHSGGDYHTYDVSPDGKRFLVPRHVVTTVAETSLVGPESTGYEQGLTVAMHRTGVLKKK